jgi:hypothetical protein
MIIETCNSALALAGPKFTNLSLLEDVTALVKKGRQVTT